MHNNNQLIPIGHNVGIQSAQAISEPLTQAAMKTFHTGGIASGGGGVFGGFEHVSNFLEAPETFKNRATLSTMDGKVDKITSGSAGGHHIEINGADHFIAPRSGELLVKKGDKIKKGDLLNLGVPHPKDALHLLGDIEGIHKIVDTLHGIYSNSDIQLDRRNLETVVRGTTGFGLITNEGTNKHYVKGDIVPLSGIATFNKDANKIHEVNLHDAYGMALGHRVEDYPAGTRIDSGVIKTLHNKHKVVKAKHLPIEYERTLIGVRSAPLFSEDPLQRLGYRYLKRGLQEAAAYGETSETHGYSPIPAFVTGQLTAGENGKY